MEHVHCALCKLSNKIMVCLYLLTEYFLLYFASMQPNVKFAAFSITDICSISLCTVSLNLKDDLMNTEVTFYAF
jgi:hypothetical protein